MISQNFANPLLQMDWYLEGYLSKDSQLWRVGLAPFPFRVGRRTTADLFLPCRSVSGEHAEFFMKGDELWLRDLNSTNGTFVNQQRITTSRIQVGDIIYFADVEFRVRRRSIDMEADSCPTEGLSNSAFQGRLAVGIREFPELIAREAVSPVFQPIVHLAQQTIVGFEALGRGNMDGLPPSPRDLFELAEALQQAPALSRLFRRASLAHARDLPGRPMLFLNTHPSEGCGADLAESLAELRRLMPIAPMVVEIHEGSVSDLNEIRWLRSQLRSLNIGLAYDDFGAGQARLVELVDVPPDFLKFDISLVRDIDKAPYSKQVAVAKLVNMVTELGVAALAEGVERPGEALACQQLGFDFAQGYYFGRPESADFWIKTQEEHLLSH